MTEKEILKFLEDAEFQYIGKMESCEEQKDFNRANRMMWMSSGISMARKKLEQEINRRRLREAAV